MQVTVDSDLKYYTQFISEVNGTPQQIQDSRELSEYRILNSEYLQNKGVYYAESKLDLLLKYKYLKYTSMFYTNNDVFTGRYLLPIYTPNKQVYTFMGYDPHHLYKYQIPKISVGNWVGQGRLLGNLDSIYDATYKSNVVYVCEGLFDAYRINVELNHKSIALLGINLTKPKRDILTYIKHQGFRLIYVPDYDSSGTKEFLIKNKLWDDVLTYKKYGHPDLKLYEYEYLDIDDFYKIHHLNNLKVNLPVV